LFKFLEDLKKLEYKKFYDKKLLKLHLIKGSIINNNFNIGKVEYAIPKKLIPNVKSTTELFDAVSFYLKF